MSTFAYTIIRIIVYDIRYPFYYVSIVTCIVLKNRQRLRNENAFYQKLFIANYEYLLIYIYQYITGIYLTLLFSERLVRI